MPRTIPKAPRPPRTLCFWWQAPTVPVCSLTENKTRERCSGSERLPSVPAIWKWPDGVIKRIGDIISGFRWKLSDFTKMRRQTAIEPYVSRNESYIKAQQVFKNVLLLTHLALRRPILTDKLHVLNHDPYCRTDRWVRCKRGNSNRCVPCKGLPDRSTVKPGSLPIS